MADIHKVILPKGNEIVLAQIKEKIGRGEWAPGDRLPSVVDLAVLFGVGRSTIREALSALKAMGWLDIRQGGGTFVRPVPTAGLSNEYANLLEHSESILELLQVRRVLEIGCIRQAAMNRTEQDIIAMKDILDRMSLHITDEGMSDALDVEFHLSIAGCTHNSLLIRMSSILANQLKTHIHHTRQLWFFADRSSAQSLLAEHQALFHAIRHQDSEQAGRLMERHINKVEQVIKQAF